MNRFLRRLSIIALSWISLFRTAQADIEIRYIDDELGDSATGVLPEYSPATQWSFGPTCFNCYDKQYINTSDVFGRSWHETLINQFSNKTTLSLSFTGECYTECGQRGITIADNASKVHLSAYFASFPTTCRLHSRLPPINLPWMVLTFRTAPSFIVLIHPP
jgi:hypothetical protein